MSLPSPIAILLMDKTLKQVVIATNDMNHRVAVATNLSASHDMEMAFIRARFLTLSADFEKATTSMNDRIAALEKKCATASIHSIIQDIRILELEANICQMRGASSIDEWASMKSGAMRYKMLMIDGSLQIKTGYESADAPAVDDADMNATPDNSHSYSPSHAGYSPTMPSYSPNAPSVAASSVGLPQLSL